MLMLTLLSSFDLFFKQKTPYDMRSSDLSSDVCSSDPLNAFLTWLLIFGNRGFPRLELVGAAWGTLITRSLIFFVLAGIIFSHKRFRRYLAVRSSQWKFKWGTMRELLRIGVPKIGRAHV